MSCIKYLTADVDGLRVFYRKAGLHDAPALLLLHGFPSAGHMFRDLIPALSDRYHVVVRFLDTGHFALETHAEEIAAAIREFIPG